MIKLLDLLKEIKSKPKAIFMAGPAGSGKTFVSAQLIPKNLTVINVDDTYEELLESSRFRHENRRFRSGSIVSSRQN
jgi:dephospho-CoA kinase